MKTEMKEKIRIGCGAGFSGDRLEPACLLVEHGEIDYLVLECLAERTIALAQKRKKQDPTKGYDLLLERRMKALLPLLKEKGVRLITNMGAANPLGGAKRIIELAQASSIQIKVAVVSGDDVLDQITVNEKALETDKPLKESGEIVSANAYLGADAIIEALKTDADIIITGRVADPSLFVAPIMYELGWELDNLDQAAQATVVGHLMECAGQITGGYFADPVKKQVDGLENLGHPIAEVRLNGITTISKIEGTGGAITVATAKEQLLYEVTNPFAYLTPDVTADFSEVSITGQKDNEVIISGGKGKARPIELKVSVGYKAGFRGEGEISYAGQNALERAQLAGDIIENRLRKDFPDLRIDLIGQNSLHGSVSGTNSKPYEVRLRVSAMSSTAGEAARIGEEVEALYTNGPAGGGGARKYVEEVLGIVSTLINRNLVQTSIQVIQS